MRVLVTDVTRMQPGYICVAAIEQARRTRVRPVLPGHARLPLSWVPSRGGKVDYKRVLEIGDAPRVGRRPEIEDVLTSEDDLMLVGTLPDDRFLEVLKEAAVADALASFGPELKRHPNGRSYVVPQGTGTRSLALQEVAAGTVSVFVDFGRIRARWADGMELSVTDLRLYEEDGATVRLSRVAELNHLLQREPGFVAFGLTRSWPGGDPPLHHWLQVNAIHVAGALGWCL